jgi:hypothetical protein
MISNYQSTDFPKAFPLFIPYLSNMSAPIEQVSQQVPLVEEVKVKKPKKPSLPAKHAKFMQFGAWFAQQLLESGDIDSELFIKMRTKLTVFDEFHAQMSFYSTFADQHKDFNKSLRKDLVAHRRAIAKANKPPPKSKKAPLSDISQSDFIADIISHAQSSLPLTSLTSPPAQTTSPLPKQKQQKKSPPTDTTPEVVQQSLESPPLPQAPPSVTLPPTPPPSTDNKPLTMKKPKKVKKTSATDEPTA